MRRVVLFVAFYLILAVVLGFAFSWSWAAVVILVGLIPAGGVWLAFRQMEDSHLDWDQAERNRNQHR